MNQLSTPDFSQFKLRVNIKTPVENVYKAWATSAGLTSWFAAASFTDEDGNIRPADAPAQTNDHYRLQLSCEGVDAHGTGKVLQANGKNIFSFTFSKGCPVSISIYPEHGETIVELFESKLPTDSDTIQRHYVGDSKGWIFFLTNLKSVLEGGLDLRNKNEAIGNVITG
ncbi:SRPBCC family protein [Chitinophaga solisilvae]|uniref:SRPBCC family protein n=1 Tax=Chitinophaga solisilvae TaxID=1233460 RepID=UPI001369992B|nr:SRPBCC domain-containing protein [Chitinophaga solisilvae]